MHPSRRTNTGKINKGRAEARSEQRVNKLSIRRDHLGKPRVGIDDQREPIALMWLHLVLYFWIKEESAT